MGKNGSYAENYPKVLKAVLGKDIFLLDCDGKHHREEPPPAAQESPDNNHLYEKDSPTELPTGLYALCSMRYAPCPLTGAYCLLSL